MFHTCFTFEYSLLLTSIVLEGPHLRRVTLHALDKGLDVGLSGNALSYHLLDQCTCLQTRVYLLLFNPPKILWSEMRTPPTLYLIDTMLN